MTPDAIGWMVAALASGVIIVCLVALLVLRERDHRRVLEQIGNVRTIGTPIAKPVTMSREIDPEERVQRMVSEATIQNGMNELRHLYTAQGLRVPEDDVLRSEAISMLGQIEPVIDTATLSRSS